MEPAQVVTPAGTCTQQLPAPAAEELSCSQTWRQGNCTLLEGTVQVVACLMQRQEKLCRAEERPMHYLYTKICVIMQA